MSMEKNLLVDGDKCPKCKCKLPIIFDWKNGRKKKS